MCGIVGAAAKTNIVPYLVEGLLKLEYRGYDSAGLAVIETQNAQTSLRRLRTIGRVDELKNLVETEKIASNVGIAHTRWATHGAPSKRNAHPHFSGEQPQIAVVHNGIIENHENLRQELQSAGYEFVSDTDTEVIAHLLSHTLLQTPDIFAAVQIVTAKLIGAYAIAVISSAQPDRVVVARNGAPLLLGLAEHGHYAASDAMALLNATRNMIYLEEGDVAELRQDSYRIVDRAGLAVTRPVFVSELSGEAVEKGPYTHFMQKEIFEQPGAVANTLEIVSNASSIVPQLFGVEAVSILQHTESILILACGTSYHAGLTAKYWLEAIAGVPCSVEIASEYRYRQPAPTRNTLVIAISQSGETADTLAALAYAKTLGHQYTLAICNSPESALVRQSALRFLTRAGPEIGVASTKAFTTQLAALMLFTLTLAKVRGKLSLEKEQEMLRALRHLPLALQHALQAEAQIKVWAQRFAQKNHALFLGRGMHYPIALEGALKLKEISYIHAEAYAAGELKHGPLALVDKDMPVIAIAPNDALLEKLKSNLQEVRARGGELYVFADADTHIAESDNLHVIRLTEHAGWLSPILHTIPLQLLAYHVALQKGTDVDKPRNLAKSVTVE